MKKEVIIEALKSVGIELDEDKTKEFVTAINKANSADIEVAKKDYNDKVEELNQLKSKYDTDIKAKDDELAKFDLTELESLRKFKTDTETKQTESARKTNIMDMLNGKFDKNAVDLIYLAVKDNAQFNEDNSIKDKDELLKGLESKYSSFTIKETIDGAKPIQANNNSVEKQPTNLADALKEKWKK